MNPALVVQTFCKIDTLMDLCESLLRCEPQHRQDIDLIFFNDSAIGSRRQEQYLPKTYQVQQQLSSFAKLNRHRFRSITLRRNEINLGTCKTCEVALDYAFQDHDFVIFTEDDTIFSTDALEWFLTMGASSEFLNEDVWAIAGESIFFDGRELTPDAKIVADATKYAIDYELGDKYIFFNFVPSTCFATSGRKWMNFSVTRGQPNGDVDLCTRCRVEEKRCIFPIVPRVKDIGMLHPDGYSVLIHTKDKVSSLKNCYLLSDQVSMRQAQHPSYKPFDGHAGDLFSRSTLLRGFDYAGVLKGPLSSPPRASTLLEAAREAGLKSDWATALNLWLELRDSGIIVSEVHTNIGLCHLKLGDKEIAKDVILKVLEEDPTDAFAQSIMAYIMEATNDLNEAGDIWYRLRMRTDIPSWLRANAISGEARCRNRR
jgi:hypothetical protein